MLDLTELLSERVVFEYAFAGLKRYGIAHHYPNRKDGFDDRSMIRTMELLQHQNRLATAQS